MSVDATKRKLRMPPWHVPYLQKHRIYELFNEIARELVIQQPIDHLLFIKQTVEIARCNRDNIRILLICSPKVQCTLIAKRIAERTGIYVITDEAVIKAANQDRSKVKPLKLANILYSIIVSQLAYKKGWIIAGVLRNETEAKMLINHGLQPTHVFHIIAPTNPPIDELLYCNVPESWPAYRRAVHGIRKAFHTQLKEVHIINRNVDDLVEACLELASTKQHIGPRSTRLVLIGPRGSARKTLAKMVADKLNLVYVDFEHELCVAWKAANTPLGKALHNVKDHVCFDVGLLATVVNERILQEDCLERGYVLTGYPNTVDDFKCMDLMDTPPNRVIFLECPFDICRARITSRRVNVYTGSTYNLIDHPERLFGKTTKTHPKDEMEVVNAELNYYAEMEGPLREYCGETAKVVNTGENIQCAFDHICKIIMEATPPYPPRDPYTRESRVIPPKTILSLVKRHFTTNSRSSVEVDGEEMHEQPAAFCVANFDFKIHEGPKKQKRANFSKK